MHLTLEAIVKESHAALASSALMQLPPSEPLLEMQLEQKSELTPLPPWTVLLLVLPSVLQSVQLLEPLLEPQAEPQLDFRWSMHPAA